MIEIVAVLFTLISVYLTVNGNILCWPMSIIGVTFYSIIFYQNNLYADLFLQSIFFIQSIIGWVRWRKSNTLKISWMGRSSMLLYLCCAIPLYTITYLVTNNMGGNIPILDSLVSTISIIATILLVNKKIESWILWIINDIVLINVFLMNGLYISSIVYSIFLILAYNGLVEWVKKYNNEEKI